MNARALRRQRPPTTRNPTARAIMPSEPAPPLPAVYGNVIDGMHRMHALSASLMALVLAVLPNQPAPRLLTLTHLANPRLGRPWLVVSMSQEPPPATPLARVAQFRHGPLKCRVWRGPNDTTIDEGNIIKPDHPIARAFGALGLETLPVGTITLHLA